MSIRSCNWNTKLDSELKIADKEQQFDQSHGAEDQKLMPLKSR